MTTVPHLDLSRQHASLRAELLDALAGVIDSCAFVGGRAVGDFERAFAEHCGAGHAIGVASGTDAVKLALRAVGVGPGHEVIVPAYTFVATAGAVLELGAVPVLADVEEGTAHVDPEDAARRITDRTRAVVPVHLYGLACDVDRLRAAVDAAAPGRDLPIVEDAAQAHGARRDGVRVGALGRAAAFSFYPTKNLGGLGDGGAVTTDDAAVAESVRMLSDHGRPVDPRRRGEHLGPGVNSRLDALQAAALGVKLERLDDWNARRAAIAERYRAVLSPRDDVRLQELPDGADHAWYLFALRHPRRDALAEELERRGVQVRATYPLALHEVPAFAGLADRSGALPQSEAWAREVLTLPIFPELTDSEVAQVLEALPPALEATRR